MDGRLSCQSLDQGGQRERGGGGMEVYEEEAILENVR